MILQSVGLYVLIKDVMGTASKNPVTDQIEIGTYKGAGHCEKLSYIKDFELKIETRDGQMFGQVKATITEGYRKRKGMTRMDPFVWFGLTSEVTTLEVDNLGKISTGRCFMFDRDDKGASKKFLISLFRRHKTVSDLPTGQRRIFFCLDGPAIILLLGVKGGAKGGTVKRAWCGYKLFKTKGSPMGETSETLEATPLAEAKLKPTSFDLEGLYEASSIWQSSHKAVLNISRTSGNVLCTISFYGDETVDLREARLEENEDGCMHPKTGYSNTVRKSIKFIYWTISPNWGTVRICPAPEGGGWELLLLSSESKLPFVHLKLQRKL